MTPGRNVKDSDMHLLDMIRTPSSTPGDETAASSTTSASNHQIIASWDPNSHNFKLLNTETQKGDE